MVAAKRVFSANGFNKSTMEDIAREAELEPRNHLSVFPKQG